MKNIQEVTIGFIIFLLLDRFSRAVSTTLVHGNNMDQASVQRIHVRIELLTLAVCLIIAFRQIQNY
jgi:hypothetical protein